jgi:hypothetical protein
MDLAEARTTLRQANRILAARRKAGLPLGRLVEKRNQLRDAIASHEPEGRVECRRARSTGTLVGLYRSGEGGLEDDPELPWTVVCEDHSALVSMATREQGRTAMSCPEDWCPYCSGEETHDD